MELSNMLDLFISALLSLIFSIFIVAKVFDKEIIKNKFNELNTRQKFIPLGWCYAIK